jgi:hypothetical protein
MKFEAEDEAIGLKVKASGKGPATLDQRLSHGDPGAVIRGLNNGISAHPAVRSATMADGRIIPRTAVNFSLEVGNDGQLHLPGGSLTVVGLSPTFTFFRNFETIVKAE